VHIHALTLDRGGCFHYRIRQPLTALRDLGHTTSWGSGVDFETWDRANVIIGQYLHDQRTADDWCRWAEDPTKLLVWEADDDIFSVHNVTAHGNAYDDPATLPRMVRMLETAHLVTVTTETLADVYRPYNPHVVVLPNCVPDWLTEIDPLHYRYPKLDDFTIGYTGSASHYEDFLEWTPILNNWMRFNSHRTRLKLFGHNGRPTGAPLSYRIETTPWQKDTATYLRSLNGAMDVGVAFLNDTEFNAGKSPIKAMEYAALGIPCVATDHPIYRDVIIDGVTGFLCKTSQQWHQALRRLADDIPLRMIMGQNARYHAEAEFKQSQWAPAWEDAYTSAANLMGIKL